MPWWRINRKYGKDNAIQAFLMHTSRLMWNVVRVPGRCENSEAINLFLPNDTIENNAHRNMVFDRSDESCHVVLQNAVNSKDMEVYGNLTVQAARI